MSETGQQLAFTHPIVVLKSGLKNNWMKKLDCVNRPLRTINSKYFVVYDFDLLFTNHR